MSRQTIIDELNSMNDLDDWERAHCRADDLLCELLISLGYEDVVNAYKNVNKWYA